MKTPLTGIQSNVLNILTSLALMGAAYIVTGKKLSPPSSAVLAVIDSVFLLFCLTWITFCLQAPELSSSAANTAQEQTAFVHGCIWGIGGSPFHPMRTRRRPHQKTHTHNTEARNWTITITVLNIHVGKCSCMWPEEWWWIVKMKLRNWQWKWSLNWKSICSGLDCFDRGGSVQMLTGLQLPWCRAPAEERIRPPGSWRVKLA